jgi:transposase
MEIPDARSLSPEAQEALRQRVVHAIEAEGMGIPQAARAFGVHRGTASRWYHAYRRQGDAALAARARGRKPTPLLTPAQEARLLAVLQDRTPDQLGLADTLWTRDAVADWAARELGVRRCFRALEPDCDRISCSVKIDYRKGPPGRLDSKVRKVQALAGKPLKTDADTRPENS